MSKTIMLVDADEISRFIMHALLKSAGFSGNIIHYPDIEDAIEHLHKFEPDIVILDFFLNESDRFRILQLMEKLMYRSQVIIMWDLNEDYVRQISILFPTVSMYYQKPLKLEHAQIIIGELKTQN